MTTQLQGAASGVATLQSTANRWGLACEKNSQIQLELAYVRDALDQGNILGARGLLKVSIAQATTDGKHGLLPDSEATQFTTQATRLLASIPSAGSVPNEFHRASTVPRPTAAGCPGTAPGGHSSAGARTVSSASDNGIADQEEILRAVAQYLASNVPHVGEALAMLVAVLWPQQQYVTWDEMSAYVDAKIGQAIDNFRRQQLDSYLQGIISVLQDYILAAQKPQPWSADDKSTIKAQFLVTLAQIKAFAPQFETPIKSSCRGETPGDQWNGYLVLPEYTQAHNLLLSQLRDGIVNGPSFGLDPAQLKYPKQLSDNIACATNYLATENAAAVAALPDPAHDAHYHVNVFNGQAALQDALIPATTDQSYYWPYLNPSSSVTPCTSPSTDCPSSVQPPPNNRLLAVPALGSMENDGTPQVASGGDITGMVVWGHDYLNSIQMTYGAGPPGPRMGAPGGMNWPKGGGKFGSSVSGHMPGSEGVITTVYGKSGDVVNGIGFVFTTGKPTYDTGQMACLYGQGCTGANAFSYAFPGEVLSSVQIMGISHYYQSADCLVLGFRYADSLPPHS